MTFWFHPEAEKELGDATVYYASHASKLIAEAFLLEFDRARNLITRNQLLGHRGEHGLRLFHFDRFPYTIVYEADEALGPRIYAIAHQKRRPGYWSPRIEVT